MSAVIICEFFVAGVAVPQGSKSVRIVTPKGKPPFAVLYDDNPNLKGWRATVTAAAKLAYSGPRMEDGPVKVELEFQFKRPKTVRRLYPTVKPDVDKCERAIFDSITAAGNIWRDDAQVVDSHPTKVYAPVTGVMVRVFDLGLQPQLDLPSEGATA